MINIVLKIIVILLVLMGVILVYDARIITKKFFSFGDQNEGALGLKMFGFFLSILSGIALYFLCK